MKQMIVLSSYQLIEIFFGAFIIWTGIYLVSRNPLFRLSWVIFLFLFSFGYTTFIDPVLLHSRSLTEYIYWQKLTDWPLFMAPIFYYHASLIVLKADIKKYWLIFGYLFGVAFIILDINGGWILKEHQLRFTEFKRFDGFMPGPLLAPSILFVCFYLYKGINNFYRNISKENYLRCGLPAIGGLIYLITGIFGMVSFYAIIPAANLIFMIGTVIGALLFVYSMVRYHLIGPSEKYIFDITFRYKSIAIVILILLYVLGFKLSGTEFSFEALIFLEILILLVMASHSFYDWLSTFINDLIYNPSQGFSVVNDEEIYNVLKNFHQPERLESSPLMRLQILNNKLINHRDVTPVDALQGLIRDAIEQFKPKEEENRRIKSNLKYYLLKMLVFDDAEEGQILWELGFEGYPVKILSNETRYRAPLFKISSPADYTYTSRNAFLALKKEAIHDITWRISYSEKTSRNSLKIKG